MILLREKGAHGASARCEQICMLLPQRSQGSTLKNHMLLIANTTSVASQTDPISPAHMASTSQTASSNLTLLNFYVLMSWGPTGGQQTEYNT